MSMKKFLTHAALVSVLFVSTTQVAFALPISTATHLAAQSQQTTGLPGAAAPAGADRASAWLQREDVSKQLVGFGVSVAEAQARLATLSDQDLARVNAQIDKAPAGGDGALAIIGVVLIVLVILEILGVIDIFKKV